MVFFRRLLIISAWFILFIMVSLLRSHFLARALKRLFCLNCSCKLQNINQSVKWDPPPFTSGISAQTTTLASYLLKTSTWPLFCANHRATSRNLAFPPLSLCTSSSRSEIIAFTTRLGKRRCLRLSSISVLDWSAGFQLSRALPRDQPFASSCPEGSLFLTPQTLALGRFCIRWPTGPVSQRLKRICTDTSSRFELWTEFHQNIKHPEKRQFEASAWMFSVLTFFITLIISAYVCWIAKAASFFKMASWTFPVIIWAILSSFILSNTSYFSRSWSKASSN